MVDRRVLMADPTSGRTDTKENSMSSGKLKVTPPRWTVAVAVSTAALTLAAFMVAVVAATAARTGLPPFDDVGSDHPHRGDIEHAVDKGWFFGYNDGTFKPDRIVTPNQITKILPRAFPFGSTRAELSSFLRGGTERLDFFRGQQQADRCTPLDPASA